MRETDFIRQNRDKWQHFEQILASPGADPDELGKMFVEITDDLSYARTHYRNRSVRVFLNGMAQRIYQLIYKNRRKSKGGFWKRELPLAMFNARGELLLCTLLFLLSIAIGMFSSTQDPEFASVILGDSYVQMTEDNISKGDPMAVYKSMHPLEMFLAIAWNNLRVSFLTFILGAFFSIGTLMILLYNGVMVGAFLHFFIARGLSGEALITIFQHGTIELCCIVLAGSAGLTLGKGLIYPGTHTRQQAFLNSARRGIRIMAGITPYIIFAAIIESFATRLTDLPDPVRIGLILLSAALMLGYYVWLPFRLFGGSETAPPDTHEETDLPKRPAPEVEKLKTGSEIFADTLWLFRKSLPSLLGLSAAAALTLLLSIGFFRGFDFHALFSDELSNPNDELPLQLLQIAWFPSHVAGFLDYRNNLWLLLINASFSVLLFRFSMQKVGKYCLPQWKCQPAHLIPMALITLSVHAAFIFPLWIAGILLVVILSLWLPVATGTIQGKGFSSSFETSINGWIFSLYSIILIAVFQLIAMFIVNAPISYFVLDFILINFSSDSWAARELSHAFYMFFSLFCLHALSFLSFGASAFILGSLAEQRDANGLKAKVASIRKKPNAYGLERE